MKNQLPIGIFDSGIGGLTVANAILKELPKERIIYFGDTAHLPYGDKSAEAIIGYSKKITEFLLERNCKIIVIACNSASSVAYETVLEVVNNKVPVVNVIDPVVDYIHKKEYKRVGVIGTKRTIHSNVFQNRINALNFDVDVRSLATPLLAPMIESGFMDGKISKLVIKKYLENDMLMGIEALVLACTHYPLIKNEIEEFYQGKNVEAIATNEIVGKNVRVLLQSLDLAADRKSEMSHQFFVSDYTKSFEQTTQLFFGKTIHLKHLPFWVEHFKKSTL